MENSNVHALEITNKIIKLDNLELKGLREYELKSSANGTTELTLRMTIGDLKLLVD